ncbi:MAG: hypothetical protein S4CHLAM102_12900 [Chlamydiia bacterium]|nr:hypothetical protein [Chlamydiia bacterium]
MTFIINVSHDSRDLLADYKVALDAMKSTVDKIGTSLNKDVDQGMDIEFSVELLERLIGEVKQIRVDAGIQQEAQQSSICGVRSTQWTLGLQSVIETCMSGIGLAVAVAGSVQKREEESNDTFRYLALALTGGAQLLSLANDRLGARIIHQIQIKEQYEAIAQKTSIIENAELLCTLLRQLHNHQQETKQLPSESIRALQSKMSDMASDVREPVQFCGSVSGRELRKAMGDRVVPGRVRMPAMLARAVLEKEGSPISLGMRRSISSRKLSTLTDGSNDTEYFTPEGWEDDSSQDSL